MQAGPMKAISCNEYFIYERNIVCNNITVILTLMNALIGYYTDLFKA